jgi:signal transduction histidine kinase
MPRAESDYRLLSSVCHDMKASLASITVGATFLRGRVAGDDEASLRVLDAISRATQRMDQLVMSFGDLGRLQAHELELDVRPCPVGEIVDAAFERLRTDAASANVGASLEMPRAIATSTVDCDPVRIGQAMQNLSSCLLRVVPHGGVIPIRVRAGGDTIRFEWGARVRTAEQRIAVKLPRPQLAIAEGLIELHGRQLSIARAPESVTMSFSLGRPAA